jgi:hypothetical protein
VGCVGVGLAARIDVPSFDHEILVELFRNRPRLAAELLRECAQVEIRGATFEDGSSDLSQIVPVSYLADTVAIARDLDRVPIGAVIVEIQRAADDDKRWSWPVYVAALRARMRCPVTLLVLVPDDGVGRWARRSIETGHAGFVLEPIVIGPAETPHVTDPAVARASPELAILSVLAHPDVEVALAAAAAVRGVPSESQAVYYDIIARQVPEIEETTMEGYEFKSETFLRGRAKGHEEGHEEGREQGREEGREQARKELQETVLELAHRKIPTLPVELEARISSTTIATMLALMIALGEATTSESALEAIQRALAGA